MGDRSEKFTGKVADRTHTIVLHAEPDTVFPLFGPIREAEWAAGWEPRIVAGDGQAPARGCVFRTTDRERGETVWLLVQLDVEKRRIGYVRTTPQSDLAEISIGIEPKGSGQSSARISYRITGLSDAGNRYVDSFTEDWYGELIDEWAVAINHYLNTGRQLPTRL
ncbi:MAG: hypothetical protein ACXW15_06090 [Acidimicrobiia bacterium]